MKKHNGVHTVRHKMEALHLSPACQYWLSISHLVLCGHMISCSPLNTSLGTNPKHWNITHHLFRYEATFLRARSCCRERGWLLKALTRFPSAQYWSGSLSFMYSSLRCPCGERQPRSWETLLTKHLAQGDTKKKSLWQSRNRIQIFLVVTGLRVYDSLNNLSLYHTRFGLHDILKAKM